MRATKYCNQYCDSDKEILNNMEKIENDCNFRNPLRKRSNRDSLLKLFLDSLGH